MIETQSNAETHARYCATKNVRGALFLVAFCLLMVYLDWRDLQRFYHKTANYDLFWDLVSAAASVQLFLIFRCVRERLIIAGGFLIGIRAIAFRFFAPLLIPISNPIRAFFLAFWIYALLMSLTALASSMSRAERA